jgi:dTDP-4-amino-4,6-dideoxygalactose transaminase
METYRGHAIRRLPVTEKLYECLLCIPIYFDLEDEQIDEIAKHMIKGLDEASEDRSAA